MTKPNYAEIAVVLDRSGSMASVRSDTIGGFNTFVMDQKNQQQGEVKLSLVQFDDVYEEVYLSKSIQDVPLLSEATYVPRGTTALLDAVGKMVNALGHRLAQLAEEQRPSLVMFVILTDGQENASKEFALDKIKEMIKHQTEKYKWNFVFLGADQDAFQAEHMGILASNTYNYQSKDTRRTYANMSKGVSDVRYRMTTDGGRGVFAQDIGDLMRALDNDDEKKDNG